MNCRGAEFFVDHQLTNTGEFIAYMQYVDGADIQPIDLLMLGDMMPPPFFTLVPNVGWVPTVEMTVQVRGKLASPVLWGQIAYADEGVTEQDRKSGMRTVNSLPWAARQ